MKRYLMLFVIFTYLDGLGLGLNFINFKIMGKWYVLNLVTLIFLFILVLDSFTNVFKIKNIIYRATFFVFSILLLMLINSSIMLIKSEMNLNDFVVNGANFIVYLAFFPFVKVLNNNRNQAKFIKYLFIFSLVSALIIYIQVIFGVYSNVSWGRVGNSLTDKYRLFTPTSSLLFFFIFYSLGSFFIEKKTKIFLLFALFLSGAYLLQMHRSVIASFAILLLVYFVTVPGIRKSKKLFYSIILSLSFILIFSIVLNIIGFHFNYIFSSVNITDTELGSERGTFWLRLRVLFNTIVYIINNYPLFGRGLNWEMLNLYDYTFQGIALTPTFDSGFTNIFLIFGFVGFFSFSYLFYAIIKHSYIFARNNFNPHIQNISQSIFIFFIYLAMISFTSDVFVLSAHVIMFIFVWSFAFVILKNKKLNIIEARKL